VFSKLSGFFGGIFWRTFLLIGVLLGVSFGLSYLGAKRYEQEPRAQQAAAHVQTIVNITRAALLTTDAIMRPALLAELKEREHIQVFPREPNDVIQPLPDSEFYNLFQQETQRLLGSQTSYAQTVNSRLGLWVSFPVKDDNYWLQLPSDRFTRNADTTWLVWAAAGLVMSLIGAVAITRLINRPLKEISYAASRIREGDFSQELVEKGATEEIISLNRGFNRMARALGKMDDDRNVMLAGISHDLRTPLTRLRLEAELSVADPTSREAMIKDIEQVNQIIGKFLEYARPISDDMGGVDLRNLVENVEASYRGDEEIRLYVQRNYSVMVLADSVELQRVLVNLIENARRYGKSKNAEHADLHISVQVRQSTVEIIVRDHGQGVPPEQLASLTQPFYRGDSARTEVKGSGLGLAIVERVIERMGGRFYLKNVPTSGLAAHIELQRAAEKPEKKLLPPTSAAAKPALS
jgi:two-component system, OmpR family, osmolarity sensor histidine kinase EnvZ